MYKLHEYKSGLEARKFFDSVTIESTSRFVCVDRIKIGKGSYIGHDTKLYGYPLNSLSITIGNDTWIGADCFIHGAGGVNIGNRVGIGPGVYILSSEHLSDGHPCVMANPIQFRSVVIASFADIGAGARICPGVCIGEVSIVGMVSVVTKDIPKNQIWVGNPARYLRDRVVSDLPNVTQTL